jgi:hypothetical protein
MALTSAQRESLREAARETGASFEELVAAAEEELGQDTPAAPKTAELPKLFQYHLPYIRVRELRKIWLQLEERLPDDDMVSGKWLERHGGVLGGGNGSTTE